DENNTRADRADSDQDIRHNFTFDAGYDIPSLRQTYKSLPKWLFDGWQLNSITQVRSGFPVNVTITGGAFGGAYRPNLVPGVSTKCANFNVPNCQFNIA